MTNEILKFKGRLKPVVEVTMSFTRRNSNVLALQDLFHYLQMATYWIQGAANELFITQDDDDLSYGEDVKNIPLPETPNDILGGDDKTQLIFIYDELEALEKDILHILNTEAFESTPEFWLKNAASRVIESKFCVILTALQYEALRNFRETNILGNRGV